MESSPRSIGIPKCVVRLAVVAFCASSAMAQQYEVPNCVHKVFGLSHRTYEDVAEESVFEGGPLVLRAKQLLRDGTVNSTIKPEYVVVAQWPRPGTDLDDADTVDIIVVDNNQLNTDFKKVLMVTVATALVVGLLLGWVLRILKERHHGTIAREARKPSA